MRVRLISCECKKKLINISVLQVSVHKLVIGRFDMKYKGRKLCENF